MKAKDIQADPTLKGVIFDLDGTLLDTIEDIADAMNLALGSLGFAQHDTAVYKGLVGSGVHALARQLVGPSQNDDGTIDQVAALTTRHYSQNMYNKTRPYAGIEDLLAELHNRQLPMAVLSNKVEHLTREMVGRYFDASLFVSVRGAREGIPLKPDPASAIEVAAELGLPCQNCLYVGDTDTDMKTAHNAGMRSAGVLWGFRDAPVLKSAGAQYLIKHPARLLDLFTA